MEDDYESLPQSSSVSTHMLAGAAAGIMEHCIMYPVDCVKTRMQCLVPNPRANYRGVFDALRQIIRYEGMRNTVRGISAVVGGAGPAHAMYFACYEHVKKSLTGTKQGNPLANGVAGVAATLLHDAVMNPAEVVKQRMQMYGSPYSSCYECGKKIAEIEGPKAFYRSYITQLTMNIPFQASHFITYELMQDFTNPDRMYNPRSHMVSGAIAGAISAGITTPLDVCKTLLNTQEKCALREGEHAISGMVQAFRTIYQFQGAAGFMKGFHARVIYQMPATGVTWSVYEFFKYMLNKNRTMDDGYVSASSGVASVQPLHAVHAKSS